MKKSHSFILLSSLVLTLSFAEDNGKVGNSIYKWKQNDMIYYSHIRPAGVEGVEVLDSRGFELENINNEFSELDEIIRPKPKKDKKSDELDKVVEKVSQEEAKKQEEKEQEDLKKKNCEISRKNLEAINSGEVYETNKKGDKIRLREEQLESKLKNIKRDIDYYCN